LILFIGCGLCVGHLLIVKHGCKALPLLEPLDLPYLSEKGFLSAPLIFDHLLVSLLLLVTGVFSHHHDLLLDLLLILRTHVIVWAQCLNGAHFLLISVGGHLLR
jgi:hypothetical protein